MTECLKALMTDSESSADARMTLAESHISDKITGSVTDNVKAMMTDMQPTEAELSTILSSIRNQASMILSKDCMKQLGEELVTKLQTLLKTSTDSYTTEIKTRIGDAETAVKSHTELSGSQISKSIESITTRLGTTNLTVEAESRLSDAFSLSITNAGNLDRQHGIQAFSGLSKNIEGSVMKELHGLHELTEKTHESLNTMSGSLNEILETARQDSMPLQLNEIKKMLERVPELHLSDDTTRHMSKVIIGGVETVIRAIDSRNKVYTEKVDATMSQLRTMARDLRPKSLGNDIKRELDNLARCQQDEIVAVLEDTSSAIGSLPTLSNITVISKSKATRVIASINPILQRTKGYVASAATNVVDVDAIASALMRHINATPRIMLSKPIQGPKRKLPPPDTGNSKKAARRLEVQNVPHIGATKWDIRLID